MMNEHSQLIYIKLILLAAETYNKIPKNDDVLKLALRSTLDIVEFTKCIKEIKLNFPKLKENKHFRYFAEFETKTNFRSKKDFLRESLEVPKCSAEKEKKRERKEEEDKHFLDLIKDWSIEEKEAWVSWLDYRKEARKTVMRSTAIKQIKFLEKQPNLISCIDRSIRNGYTGLFADKISINGTVKKETTDEQIARIYG